MAKLRVRGYAEAIEVSQDVANKIHEVLNDKRVSNNEFITLDNGGFVKGDIRGIIFDERIKVETTADESHKQYMAEREKFFSLPLEKKLYYLTRSKCWYTNFHYAIRGEDPSLESTRKAYAIAQEFYVANSRRMYPDMALFKDLIGKVMQGSTQMESTSRERLLNILMDCERMDRSVLSEEQSLLALVN